MHWIPKAFLYTQAYIHECLHSTDSCGECPCNAMYSAGQGRSSHTAWGMERAYWSKAIVPHSRPSVHSFMYSHSSMHCGPQRGPVMKRETSRGTLISCISCVFQFGSAQKWIRSFPQRFHSFPDLLCLWRNALKESCNFSLGGRPPGSTSPFFNANPGEAYHNFSIHCDDEGASSISFHLPSRPQKVVVARSQLSKPV